MKKTLSFGLMALMVLSVMPAVFAVSVGSGVGVDIVTEDFAPRVWSCGSRLVRDDATEPGRITLDGDYLTERTQNYAFEGEQIGWTVLVMDKNKIDQGIDVYATIGSAQGEGNDIEVNCQRLTGHVWKRNISDCNARIQEETLTFNPETMAYFSCLLTVETPDSMEGEHFITVEAMDLDGEVGTMAENEYWFLNPVIALSVEGDIAFEDVRPGTDSYSETLLVGNDAEDGSGVLLDMFISGTDFYDSSSSAARCEGTNSLLLKNFRYFATNGAYSTLNTPNGGVLLDAEGYRRIAYGIGFNDPNPFYGVNEIMPVDELATTYSIGNILAPGAEMALTFKLSLPEPCNGDFDSGAIYFWGEAI